MLTDVFGVPLEVGQRVLYAATWHHYAALHVGTLIALVPTPVVQPDTPGLRALPRPAQALAVITWGGSVHEAEAWLRRRLDEIDDG